MDFTIEHFLELREEFQKLRRQGKTLEDSKLQEWRRYFILFTDDIFYQNIEQYFNILESFIQNDITVQEFIDRFTKLRIQDVYTTSYINENLTSGSLRAPNPKALGFADIISDINSLIVLFTASLDNPLESEPLYEISENKFREYLQEDMSLIRQYLEKS